MKSADKEVASKRFDPFNGLLLLAFLIGAFIRLYDFDRWSLFNDELSTIFRANYDSLYEVWSIGVKTDVHPVVNETFIYVWMNFFGDSPFAVRLPYVIFSILALYFFYRFGLELLNKTAAALSVTIMSLTQLFVIYGQVARPYSIGLLLLMIFSFAWIKMIKSSKLKWVILSGIFACLSAMTHYFLTLTVFLVYVAGFSLINYRKKQIIQYLLSGLLALLLFLPHLGLSLHQIGRKGLGWLPSPEEDFIWQFLLHSFNESWILLLLVFIAPLLGLVVYGFKIQQIKNFSFLFIFLISYWVGYYYSVKVNPVIQFSSLIFAFPFMIVFLFSFLTEERNKVNYTYFGLILIVSALSLQLNAKVMGPKRFGNFEGVAEGLIAWKKEKGDDLIVFSNSSSPDYFHYFYKENDASFEEEMDYFDGYNSLRQAAKIIQESEASFLALGFANSPIPAEVYELARLFYPKVIEHKRFFNSDLLLLGKEETINSRPSSFYSVASVGKEKWEVNESLINDSLYYSKPSSFEITAETEYALTFRAKVGDVFEDWPDWLTIGAKIKATDSCKIKCVVAIDRGSENLDWRSMDLALYYQKDQWFNFCFVYPMITDAQKDDDLLIYFWNPDGSAAFVDDFELINYKDANFDYYQLR